MSSPSDGTEPRAVEMITDRTGFIRANTRLRPVPHAPEIVLHVADEATALWQKTEDELGEIGLAPPFWAFAWAGGQALARYILDHPEWVAGQSVLDVASGSGLVAIAAARSGAARVRAIDIDAFAAEATALNAAANNVVIEAVTADLIGVNVPETVILAGDVFYQRDMADRLVAWFVGLSQEGKRILVGDPGRSYVPHEHLEKKAEYSVPVTRELEDFEIKRSAVYEFRHTPAKPGG